MLHSVNLLQTITYTCSSKINKTNWIPSNVCNLRPIHFDYPQHIIAQLGIIITFHRSRYRKDFKLKIDEWKCDGKSIKLPFASNTIDINQKCCQMKFTLKSTAKQNKKWIKNKHHPLQNRHTCVCQKSKSNPIYCNKKK